MPGGDSAAAKRYAAYLVGRNLPLIVALVGLLVTRAWRPLAWFLAFAAALQFCDAVIGLVNGQTAQSVGPAVLTWPWPPRWPGSREWACARHNSERHHWPMLADALAIVSTRSYGRDMQPLRNLGGYIREQRNSSQVSLRQLAAAAGVSNPYLSQIERGLRKPSAEILQQIAKALRISAEALYVQAGILDERVSGTVVANAIHADTQLSERQKQVLLEIYESFCKELSEPAGSPPAPSKPVAVKRATKSRAKKAAKKTTKRATKTAPPGAQPGPTINPR